MKLAGRAENVIRNAPMRAPAPSVAARSPTAEGSRRKLSSPITGIMEIMGNAQRLNTTVIARTPATRRSPRR